ncbi:F-box only protein 44-like isoform X2 [Convolutriloba macropyga]|uniref:F-box only protein 44-like isoform X2 n=1 Tax=Convolutriloba macropyga TaxID=536237 RepID=UPI003F5227F2
MFCHRDTFGFRESRKHWLYREKTAGGQENGSRGSGVYGDSNIASYEEEEEEEEETLEELRRRYPNENDPEVYRYSRHGFSVEERPIGAEPIPEEAGVPTQHCFVTSYHTGVRRQLIDIGKYKMKDGVMQLLKPSICYSQWVASRGCDGRADLSLLVTSGEWKMSPKSLQWHTQQEGVEGKKWYKMEGRVEVPVSIDWIIYQSSGSDLVFWNGNYGPKTTACSLIMEI